MGFGYDALTPTSLGTGTAKTTLNGGAIYTPPAQTNCIISFTPFWTPGTLTAAQAVNGDFIVESSGTFSSPTRFLAPPIYGGLGTFASANHPTMISFETQIPYNANSNPQFTFSGQALDANTSAPKLGAIMYVSDQGSTGRQLFWNKRNGITTGATTAGSVTETTWQLSNCESIHTMYAAVVGFGSGVTASESVSGIVNFYTGDMKTTLPQKITINPLVSALGTAVAIINPRTQTWDNLVPTNPTVNLSPVITTDKNLTNAVDYATGVAYYQINNGR